jgi:hypothetical protein
MRDVVNISFGMGVCLHLNLSLRKMAGDWQLHAPASLPLGENIGSPLICA